jgi:hypothetical protein
MGHLRCRHGVVPADVIRETTPQRTLGTRQVVKVCYLDESVSEILGGGHTITRPMTGQRCESSGSR